MFIPVGPDGGSQDVWTVDKDEVGNVKKTRLFGVRVRPASPSSFLTRPSITMDPLLSSLCRQTWVGREVGGGIPPFRE